METKRQKLEQIHDSLINGQRKQMTKQIDEYGLYDFFEDYYYFLIEVYVGNNLVLNYFVDVVKSYHRIKNR
jgi:hypothetical protein